MTNLGSSPLETKTFDLVVCGGGLAGVCAAIAAARDGAKVALVQDRPVLGGCSSSEIRVVPYGCSHNNAWTNETGIGHDLILADRAANHEDFFDHGMVNSRYDLTIEQTARRERNLELFFNTSVRFVEVEGVGDGPMTEGLPTANRLGRLGGSLRRILAVRASQMGSEREYRFVARQFVDATGDGTIGYLAGADFRYGREARGEFGEPLAPVKSDDTTMGSTITMRARDVGRPVRFDPPPGTAVYRTPADVGPGRGFYHIGEKNVFGGYWWLEICNPYHQIGDCQAIREELHRHVLGIWDYLKNHSKHQDALANFALDWIGMIPGKRESRRLAGDALVTEHHCHRDAGWPDGVAYAGWWIDLHMKGGILNKTDPGERENIDERYKHWIRLSPFSLPLRAMYSRNVENLWMAGRCYSLTHVGLGPVRVQLTLAAQGQAVGHAAAWAVRRSLTPRLVADPAGAEIASLRQHLLRNDLRVLGLRNADPADLALRARAAASSERPLVLETFAPGGWTHLDRPRAQVLPAMSSRIEDLAFLLRNEAAASVRIEASIQAMRRIWDREDAEPIHRVSLEVPGHHEGWIPARLGIEVSPGRSYRIALSAAPGVCWAFSREVLPGLVAQYRYDSPGGCEPKNAHLPSFAPDEIALPAYRHWRQMRRHTFLLKFGPAASPYGAANVNNGCAWVEDLPNIWISDPAVPLPQHVELAWPTPVAFDTAVAFFDTNLDLTTGGRPAFWRAPECIRDWRLVARVDGGWRTVHEETGNYLRRRTVHFERVVASALRLEALATNGAADARVYELRVYDSLGTSGTS